MQTAQDVEKDIIAIIADHMQIDPSEITRESAFVADLGMDSLDVVEVTMEFEDHFNISIPDEATQSIQTVGQAADFVMAQAPAT